MPTIPTSLFPPVGSAHPTLIRPAALLIFLPAAAGAGVVSADFFFAVADGLHHVIGLPWLLSRFLRLGLRGDALGLGVLGSRDFPERTHEGRTFYHGHTYTGNPLGCAAALASLKMFDDNRVLQNIAGNAAILKDKLAVLEDHPSVLEVRQKGVMVGIHLVQDRMAREAFPTELRMGHQVTLAARRLGVVIRPLGDVVVLMPAPAMPADLVALLCEKTVEAIQEACSSL